MEQVILKNRYHLGKRIGVGGMAYVYEAEDLLLKRKVAVKILKQQFVDDEEFLKKFENEAQSAASLNHPNIVNVYDVGREVIDERILHYIVMELVEGTTLKDVIQVQGHLSNAAIARISAQIARALNCAHEHNIIHRDIKPANILIMKSGDVKVADFGIARISSTATITYTNSILGTVHYISPEQAKGKFIDRKSDIYSLGVVMYEMATGKVPFDAENSVGIAIKHIQEEPIPPNEKNAALSPGLNQIILKCLAKDPAMRYFDTQELIHALESYKTYSDTELMTHSVDAQTARMDRRKIVSKESTYQSPANYEDNDDEDPKSGRGRVKWLVLIALLSIALAVGMIFLISRNEEQRIKEDSTVVPDLYQMEESSALELLKERELEGAVVRRANHDTIPKGSVIDQSIAKDTTVPKKTRVDLVVSSGREQISVPDVIGQTADQAAEQIQSAGLVLNRTTFEPSDTVEKGRVIGIDPGVGQSVELGSKVTLRVSTGKTETETFVPTLVGQTQAEALNSINQANLSVGEITSEPSDTYRAGLVIRQTLEAGERVEKNTAIGFTVSTGMPQASSSSEESSNTSEQSSSSVEKVNYNLEITAPTDKERFTISIYDASVSETTPVFEREYTKSEVPADGIIRITIVGTPNSVLKTYYDGVLGQPKTTTP
ncbi:MAG: Stk1 family PASTA domain-containing Ser/Thr kinase [Ndongobacter sp.]|nr:Stk1 family PASTA domain-containing Ser/Thr kinase [Ndongobacter sp.]